MSEQAHIEADARLVALSHARRTELLALPWWTSEQVSRALGPQGDDSSDAVSRLRASRALLGVWDGRQFLHPDFQFKDGLLTDRLDELLAALPSDDRNGWRRAMWCYAPHGLLKGRTPADVWQENSDAVIVAAKDSYESPLRDF